MSVLTSEVFRFLTPAHSQDVRNELTRTGEPAAHLYGLIIQLTGNPSQLSPPAFRPQL